MGKLSISPCRKGFRGTSRNAGRVPVRFQFGFVVGLGVKPAAQVILNHAHKRLEVGKQLAAVNHARAIAAAERLTQVPGVELVNESFFNEFTLKLPKEARPAVRALAEAGVLGGVSLGRLYPGEESLANGLIVAVAETVTDDDIAAFAKALEGVLA